MLVPRMTPMSSTEAPMILRAHVRDSHLRAILLKQFACSP